MKIKINENRISTAMLYLFITLITASSCKKNNSGSGNGSGNDTVATVKYIDTLPHSVAFKHPGLLHTQADFDRMKTKVTANAEPWLSGWNKLIANSHAQVSYTPGPTTYIIRGASSLGGENYSRAYNDAAAAYQLAIRWKITGDARFAQAAINILNAWAVVCQSIEGDTNASLAAGIYGYQFANAAEILRDYSGWSSIDFTKFKNWMLTVWYPKNHDFLVRHHNACITHYWANWDLCNLASVMSIGVLCDSRQLYNEAIYYLMHGAGNGNMLKAINYVYAAEGLAQWQESGRDQGHATLCTALLGAICEMAWSRGDDLYGFNNNLFLKGSEYCAKYNVAKLTVPFTTYNWGSGSNCADNTHTVISDAGRGTIRPEWELIYNHYVKRKGLTATYTTIGAQWVRPEGGGGDYGPNSGGFDELGFGTLMYSRD